MDKKTEFNEALLSLVEYAAVNGNIISKDTVHEYFKDIISDETMYDSIYAYLSENKINIEGYKKPVIHNDESQCFTPVNAVDTKKACMFLDMYYEDVSKLKEIKSEELSKLVRDVLTKNKEAVNSLTEAFLPNVIKIADEFENSGIKKSDLISEGNLGLLEGIIALKEIPSDIVLYFENIIRNAMNSALQNEIGALRTANHITDRANAVSDATATLAEKLGRKATIEELCEYLSLPEDEVRQILKFSLDALNSTGADA